MNKMVMIGMAAAVMALTACGPKHMNKEYAKYDPSMSKAMNLALLTGITKPEGPLKDSAPIKVVEQGADPLKDVGTATDIALLAAQSTGLMLDIGMGVGASMAMGGLGLLVGSPTIFNPALSAHIFAWMPKDFAKDSSEASKLLSDMIYKVVKQELLNSNYRITKDRPSYAYKAFSDAQAFEVTFITEDNSKAWVTSAIAVPDMSEVDSTWVSPQPSYEWLYKTNSNDTVSAIGISVSSSLNFGPHPASQEVVDKVMHKIYTRISNDFPDWIYIYVAPNTRDKTPPYFLNKGKVLPFIKPVAAR